MFRLSFLYYIGLQLFGLSNIIKEQTKLQVGFNSTLYSDSLYLFEMLSVFEKFPNVFISATDNCGILIHNICMLNKDEKLKLLGKNIAKYRKKNNFSQNTFAEIIDVSREHIAKIETAKRCLSLSLLFKAADALNVQEKVLFEFNQKEQ